MVRCYYPPSIGATRGVPALGLGRCEQAAHGAPHLDGCSHGKIQKFDVVVLQDAGRVAVEVARAHTESEFEKYRIVQDRLFESDFDRVVIETKRLGEGAAKRPPRKGKKKS